ncbi:MAG: DUF4330 domain-containing protein [Clostridia bacterium]|nr:DUF4330 domain-containing protein [Clostridia bacterium]
MEQKTPKFRLRLNLFDGIVLVLALVVGAVLLWFMVKPAPAASADTPAANSTTIRYTVRFQKWIKGTESLIEPGDKLVDNIKNYELGTVVYAEPVRMESLMLDHENRQYVLAALDGYTDVLVTVESPCTITDEAVTVGGGYALRVGATAYIRGEGYMASGPITSMEREGLK